MSATDQGVRIVANRVCAHGLGELVCAIDRELDTFRSERLHPKEVEAILGISGRERLR